MAERNTGTPDLRLVASRRTAVVAGCESCAEVWPVALTEVWLAHQDYLVVNLGRCVPVELVVDACVATPPDLVVLAGYAPAVRRDGPRALAALRNLRSLRWTAIALAGWDEKLNYQHSGNEPIIVGFSGPAFARCSSPELSLSTVEGLR